MSARILIVEDEEKLPARDPQLHLTTAGFDVDLRRVRPNRHSRL